MKWLARALGCTEGQAYSAAIVAVVATAMVIVGVPPALRDHVAAPAAAFGASPSDDVTATTTTIAIPKFGEAPSPETPTGVTPTSTGAPTVAVDDSGERFGAGDAPNGVAVARDGRVFVSSETTISSFTSKGALIRQYAVGSPVTGLTVEDGEHLVVLAERKIVRLDLGDGTTSAIATIPDVPVCAPLPGANCEPGVQEHAPAPHAVAIDGRHRFLVTDTGQATIWLIDPDHPKPLVWYQSLDLASGDGPAGIAVGNGRVRFTVGTSLDVNAPAQGAAYQLVIASDGSAGGRTLLAAFGRGTSPDGIVSGRSGRTYVALRGADTVVVLAPDGVEAARITDGMDAPSGLALGDGVLYVANTSRNGHGKLVPVSVDDA